MNPDLYRVLGVKESASADDIKKKYRELAKKYHPDRTGGDKSKETRFKEISAAYGVLSDPEKRRRYDTMRRGGFGGRTGGAGGIDLEDLFGERGGTGGFGFGFGGGGLGDLFGTIFREAGRGGGGGGGGGRSRVVFETGGRAPSWAQAPAAEEEIRTPDGHVFLKKGDDVYLDLPVTVEEAVVGARVEVPTLQGRVTVTVPAGTSSGRKLRLRGKGVGGRGDQYVVVQIVVPEHSDERARELIREFCRRAPVKPRG